MENTEKGKKKKRNDRKTKKEKMIKIKREREGVSGFFNAKGNDGEVRLVGERI